MIVVQLVTQLIMVKPFKITNHDTHSQSSIMIADYIHTCKQYILLLSSKASVTGHLK